VLASSGRSELIIKDSSMNHSVELLELINKLTSQQKNVHEVLGDQYFDTLAISKSLRLRDRLSRRGFQPFDAICLGHNLRHATDLSGNRQYTHLPNDFLTAPAADLPERALYLLLNNDIGKNLPAYVDFYQRHPDSVFVIWDWDSQHWLYMSAMLAAYSDFYVPASSENIYLLSHFNPHMLGPVFGAVNQWSRQFLVDHLDLLLKQRMSEPFGPHAFYHEFGRRNRAIATLAKSYPLVNFASNDFQKKSDLDNLIEWAQYKSHWIVPVLGGVPIRVYNALITGGIPLLPTHYQCMPEGATFDATPLYYDVGDLVEPHALNAAAVRRFDAQGQVGVVQRVMQTIEKHHVDTRCAQILTMIDAKMARMAAGHGAA
jgi:hypothetical protein